MKKKLFAYSFIFLVVFQLFSPWMMSVSQNGINIEKNTVSAAVTTGSREGTTACSIDAISEKQAFVTVGTAPGTTIKTIGIRRTTDDFKYAKKSTLIKKVNNKLFYAIRRSDQHTGGPYYLSTYVINLVANPMERSDLYCYVEYEKPNSAYTNNVFIAKSTNFTKYIDSKYNYTDTDTKVTTQIDAKIIDPKPKDFNDNDAIQFAPFAMNVLKSKEGDKNTFQIAYMFISKNREMTDGSNPFINQELSTTLMGGNSNPKPKIKKSDISSDGVNYYQRYDSKIPGLDGYYEWVFLDKNKIIDADNNTNYALDSSIKTSLSFVGSANNTTISPLTPPGVWFLSVILNYFTSDTTTITYSYIPFSYNGTNDGMHFSGILRDVYNIVKDLQVLAGGGNERFAFGIDKAKSAEGDNGIGIIVALEYGTDDWDEVITTKRPGRTKPTSDEVLESQVFDNYYDIDLLSGQAGKTIIINKNQINPEWEGFAMVLRKNQKPSTNIKNLDTDVVAMSLNPYLIGDLSNNDPFINQNYNNETNSDGERMYPFYNQRKIYIPVNIKKDIFGADETLKEGDILYAYVLSREDSSMDSNDAVISPIVEFKITDQINQVGRTYGIIDDLNKNKTEEGEDLFLPECGGFWPMSGGTITGCVIQMFYYLLFVPTSKLIEIAGNVLDFVLIYSISPGVYKVGYIVDSWRFIRDICNLFFIFMLVYLAFKIILGAGHNTKQLVVNTIIIATVINFSYPLTTLFIDVSNITARQLYYNSFSKKDEASDKPVGLSTMVASAYNPQELILGASKSNPDKNEGQGSIFMIILMGVIFNGFGIYIFLKVALQFIYRILGLVFAIILSPIALFSYSLESEMRSKLKMVGFEAWLNGLLSDCFKAPVFLFMILILALFVSQNPFKGIFGADVNGIDWWMSILIPFMIIIGFMMLILKTTENMSSEISHMVGDKIVGGIEKIGGFGIGAAAGLATGGMATLGRSTIGKWAASSAEKLRNSGKDTWWNRQKLRALDGTAKSSFDVRQTAAGNALSKATGLNMDNKLVGKIPGMSTAATAGGYMAQKDRSKQRKIDRAELWGKDTKLIEELNHQKEKQEGEVKEIETKEGTNQVLLKELNQSLKENTEALEKQEKEIIGEYDGKIRDEDDKVKIADGKISQLTAKLATDTDAEKIITQNAINKETTNREKAIKAKTDFQKEKTEKIKDLKENSELGQKLISTKAGIKTAKETEAKLGKEKNDKKYGKEIEIEEKDENGNVIIDPTTGTPKMKKTGERIGGIAGTEKAIKKVENAQMLKATLRHRKKSTGDAVKVKTYMQHYTEKFKGDEERAKAQMAEDFKGIDIEKIKNTNYAGGVTKDGHFHEITHMINDHFKPGDYKNNYKAPTGGGGDKTATPKHDKPDDHGHPPAH